MNDTRCVSHSLRTEAETLARDLSSLGSPAVIQLKLLLIWVFLKSARRRWSDAFQDLQKDFAFHSAAWSGWPAPEGILPHEISVQVEKVLLLRVSGFGVLLLEFITAICIGLFTWDLPWQAAAGIASTLTVVLALLATVFVRIVVDRDTEEDPRQALRRLDTIAIASMAVWAAAVVAVLLISRLSTTGSILPAIFHGSLILLTLAAPILAGALGSKASIYNWSRRLTQGYHHLLQTRDQLDRLELEARLCQRRFESQPPVKAIPVRI